MSDAKLPYVPFTPLRELMLIADHYDISLGELVRTLELMRERRNPPEPLLSMADVLEMSARAQRGKAV